MASLIPALVELQLLRLVDKLAAADKVKDKVCVTLVDDKGDPFKRPVYGTVLAAVVHEDTGDGKTTCRRVRHLAIDISAAVGGKQAHVAAHLNQVLERVVRVARTAHNIDIAVVFTATDGESTNAAAIDDVTRMVNSYFSKDLVQLLCLSHGAVLIEGPALDTDVGTFLTHHIAFRHTRGCCERCSLLALWGDKPSFSFTRWDSRRRTYYKECKSIVAADDANSDNEHVIAVRERVRELLTAARALHNAVGDDVVPAQDALRAAAAKHSVLYDSLLKTARNETLMSLPDLPTVGVALLDLLLCAPPDGAHHKYLCTLFADGCAQLRVLLLKAFIFADLGWAPGRLTYVMETNEHMAVTGRLQLAEFDRYLERLAKVANGQASTTEISELLPATREFVAVRLAQFATQQQYSAELVVAAAARDAATAMCTQARLFKVKYAATFDVIDVCALALPSTAAARELGNEQRGNAQQRRAAAARNAGVEQQLRSTLDNAGGMFKYFSEKTLAQEAAAVRRRHDAVPFELAPAERRARVKSSAGSCLLDWYEPLKESAPETYALVTLIAIVLTSSATVERLFSIGKSMFGTLSHKAYLDYPAFGTCRRFNAVTDVRGVVPNTVQLVKTDHAATTSDRHGAA